MCTNMIGNEMSVLWMAKGSEGRDRTRKVRVRNLGKAAETVKRKESWMRGIQVNSLEAKIPLGTGICPDKNICVQGKVELQ